MRTIILLFFTSFCLFVQAQNVNIPDSIFKNWLINNSAINTNGDSEIQLSEAVSYSGAFGISNLGASSLIGIEAFTGLTSLSAQNNEITSLDLSCNSALHTLWVGGNNNLTELNIDGAYALEFFETGNTQLSEINLSAHENLVYINVSSNAFLTCLNIANGNNSSLGQVVNNPLFIWNNPNIGCVQIDGGFDIINAVNGQGINWIGNSIEPGTEFSPTCNTPCSISLEPDFDNDGFMYYEDCDDKNPLINQDSVELCDGIDNDCDGEIDENSGCLDPLACNFDSSVLCEEINSCLYIDECGECGGDGVMGCTDVIACNYNPDASCDDNMCIYPSLYYDCLGNCLTDVDTDGVCDELEILGCTDADAVNYSSEATELDESCDYTGCMDQEAFNFNSQATISDISLCLYDIEYVNDSNDDAFDGGYNDGVESVECPLCPPCDNDCPGDYTGDGSVTVGDLLEFLLLFGNDCE